MIRPSLCASSTQSWLLSGPEKEDFWTPLIHVVVTVNRKQVTVYVVDDQPWALPAPGASWAAPAGESGRGLLLVARLAPAWGSIVYGGCSSDRKAVWFSLDRSEAAA
jgi:hypothetical protein